MSQVTQGAKSAGRSETARKVVLFGWAAKGVVYVALAYLVLQMAFGQSSQDASTTGALRLIAQEAPGKIVLVLLGLGLLAFAVGRIAFPSGCIGDPDRIRVTTVMRFRVGDEGHGADWAPGFRTFGPFVDR